MSRSKRARAKQRKHVALRAPTASRQSQPPPATHEGSRIEDARRRAAATKVAVGGAALIAAGGSMALARVTYAGHSKHPARPLSIPQPLYRVVRQNLLQGGILAPATAPPDATTSTS
jgi:hypothetical protein